MRVGAEIKIQVCPAPKPDSFHSVIQGVFKDLVLALPVMNCVIVSKAFTSYVVKEGLGDYFSPDLIVNCPIFTSHC